MKFQGLFVAVFFAIAVAACIGKYPAAKDEAGTAQYFLRACMQGDFARADFYMLKDSENVADLARMKAAYYHSNRSVQAAYSAADIIIEDNEAADVNTKIITFKNSCNNINRKLKVVRINGDWKVDLKYTFSGNL